MEKIELNVIGMECVGCENRICNALKSVNGVKKVEAFHDINKVIIELDENIDTKVLIEKIEEIGFEVK